MIRPKSLWPFIFTLFLAFTAHRDAAEKTAEKDTPIGLTKENAQKWLDRAETYELQADPQAAYNPFGDIRRVYLHTLLDQEDQARTRLDCHIAQKHKTRTEIMAYQTKAPPTETDITPPPAILPRAFRSAHASQNTCRRQENKKR